MRYTSGKAEEDTWGMQLQRKEASEKGRIGETGQPRAAGGGAEGCSVGMKEQERASKTTETEERDEGEGSRLVKEECRGE